MIEKKGIDVFYHNKNFGKGRALKNSFNYILTTYPEVRYVITADSDGQHTVRDIKNISNIVISEKKEALYLGSRNFNEDHVPFKSSFGNKTTSFIYKLLYKDSIKDTQTGLRVIPKCFLYDFLDLNGERFEYEINMLINSSMTKKQIIEIPIETVYFDGNSETHFHPILDSIKIYKVIFNTFFKFILSSLSSFLVDIGFFSLFIKIFAGILRKSSYLIWVSTILSRIISGIFNYKVNMNLVFQTKKSDNMFIKYAILWACQLSLSAFLVSFVYSKLNFNPSFIKLVIDTVIFMISYNIQNLYIFNGEKNE